jgi:hypothetical protein
MMIGCSFERGYAPKVFGDAPASDGQGRPSDAKPGDATPPADAKTDAAPNSITCPGSMCGAVCCDGVCGDVVLSVCTGRVFRCDGPEDCTGSEVCCNDKNGSYCTTSTCNGNSHFEVCHTTADCSFSCGDCSFRGDYGQQVCCE